MKRFAISFLISSLILCIGCDKDSYDATISDDYITLYYENTYQLTVTGDNNIKWSSDDEFIAKVSNSGKVTANHIGTTYIKANDIPCQVTVKPKYNLYEEPIINWTLTKSDIIRKFGTPDGDRNNILTYKIEGDMNILGNQYMFRNGRLYASTAVLPLVKFGNLIDFLLERYQPIAVNTPTYTALFIDAITLNNATLKVATSASISNYLCLSMYYAPDAFNETKAAKEDCANSLIEAYNNL